MIYVGTDIVDIERIARSLKRESFIVKVYGDEEREQLRRRGFNACSAAGAFAAKEAFAKSLGSGVRGFLLRDVQVLHNEPGAPYLKLSGGAKAAADARALNFSLSISHTDTLAQAVVIAFSGEDKE